MQLISVKAVEFKMQFLLDEIQLKTKTRIQHNTLIFFDEIQESPLLLKYLRYFYEERPDIAVVAGGSLLEIALKN
jgi:predicted AAA+ superfamily ATPase